MNLLDFLRKMVEVDFEQEEFYYMKCNVSFAKLFDMTPQEVIGKRARKDLKVITLTKENTYK